MSFQRFVRISNYAQVYVPGPNVYPGPDGAELRHGRLYQEWVPNDHGFAIDPTGRVHLFGITHPVVSPDAIDIHEGEVQLFHAICADDPTVQNAFHDEKLLFPPSDRPGEIPEIHSPAIVRLGGLYSMVYGPEYFRLATSPDLEHWTLQGVLFHDEKDARDPQLWKDEKEYCLCYCSGNSVLMRRSIDLRTWSNREILLTLPQGLSPESPFLFRHGDFYSLLVCLWDGKWDRKTVEGAYQHKTLIYLSKQRNHFDPAHSAGEIDAHAPELFSWNGRLYISSAEYPKRGINLAEVCFS